MNWLVYYRTPIFALAVIAFIFAGTLSLSHVGMSMEDGQMSECPLMGQTTVCTMNPLQHIAAWQSLFTTTIQQNGSTFALLLLMLAAFIFFTWPRLQYPPPESLSRLPRGLSRQSYLIRGFYRELFSNGILNPKVF